MTAGSSTKSAAPKERHGMTYRRHIPKKQPRTEQPKDEPEFAAATLLDPDFDDFGDDLLAAVDHHETD